ncbi:MAG: hypothetical protein AAB932_00625, partial [Patescibacteria group bacterium]
MQTKLHEPPLIVIMSVYHTGFFCQGLFQIATPFAATVCSRKRGSGGDLVGLRYRVPIGEASRLADRGLERAVVRDRELHRLGA